MGTRFYYDILMKIIPYIRFTTYYTSFRGYQFNRGYAHIQPGDFVVVKDYKKLTNFLVPGTWNHAAQIIDHNGADWEVSEMTHHNYTKSCFFDLCAEADRVAVYRCKTYDTKYIEQVVIPRCKAFENAIYDVKFDGADQSSDSVLSLGIPALYCSELVFQCDPERRIGADMSDLADLGRPYVSPDDLAQAKNVELIWDSDWEKANPVK